MSAARVSAEIRENAVGPGGQQALGQRMPEPGGFVDRAADLVAHHLRAVRATDAGPQAQE